MKINEIEAGAKFDLKNLDAEKVVSKFAPIIERRCSNAIDSMIEANRLMYRGTTTAPSAAFYGRSRDNRTSVNLKGGIQEAFDEKFRNHGFTALRSNSIYCTGASGDTQMYGATFIIFPVNGFTFTWSPKIDDLLFRIQKYFGVREHQLTPEILASDFTDELFESMDFRKDDLAAALESKNEIMIRGEYYAFFSGKYAPYFKQLYTQ